MRLVLSRSLERGHYQDIEIQWGMSICTCRVQYIAFHTVSGHQQTSQYSDHPPHHTWTRPHQTNIFDQPYGITMRFANKIVSFNSLASVPVLQSLLSTVSSPEASSLCQYELQFRSGSSCYQRPDQSQSILVEVGGGHQGV